MKIALAPMEGVVDPLLRQIYSSLGGYDHFVTEFVRVTEQVLPPHVFYRYSPELQNKGLTKEGVPVYVQILGGQAQVIADNAALAIELGSPGIDLNFGCPAKTVNRHDGGATLLKKPSRLFDIISTVKKTLPLSTPVTAKVRLGFDNKNYVTEIAQAVDEAGAQTLTIHARTKSEGYKPPAHWEYIAMMKEAVKQTSVIANGDIWNVEDYHRCFSITGCEDVALGRPAIACPDLALQIKSSVNNAHHSPLTFSIFKQKTLLPFIMAADEFKGERFALARTKQWVKFLRRQYPEAQILFEMIKTLNSVSELLKFM